MLTLLLITTVGCGKEEPIPEPEYVAPLHTKADNFDNGIVSMNSITPVTAFESVGDEVHIFPFYDCDKYISMKVVLISNNDFWKTLLDSYADTDNRQDYEKYSLITTPAGNTMVMLNQDEEHMLLIESSALPSSYVKVVADELCK